jgi:hypothetical protein
MRLCFAEVFVEVSRWFSSTCENHLSILRSGVVLRGRGSTRRIFDRGGFSILHWIVY